MKKIKKTLIAMLAVVGLFSSILCGCAKEAVNKSETAVTEQNQKVEQTKQSDEYKQFNDFFTPAFQLIWNDFSEKFIKGEVRFVGGNPEIVNNLNQKRLTDSMVSKNDLYKTIGNQTFATKKRIERELKRKFHEKSKLLDAIEWTKKADSRYVLYAMFKKDIEFSKAFKDLDAGKFNSSKENYKYFGVTKNADEYRKFVFPIYYKDRNDYAVKLTTKTNDEIILLTDNSNRKVFEIWDDFYKNKYAKKSNLAFDEDAELIVPQISFNKQIKYNEFLGKKIEDSNLVIETALEDIEFSLDKTGAKIRNEAIMGVERMSLRHEQLKKKYHFNKPFILFIKDKNADVPYFALKIKDGKYLKK